MSGTGDIGIANLNRLEVGIENYGTSVTIRDGEHSRTNHYIECSRSFFPGRTLYKYIIFRWMEFVVFFSFVVSILSFLSLYLAVVMDLINLAFLVIYLQHVIFVNCHTMLFVRKQPVISDQKSGNDFYKLTVRELSGTMLTNYENNIGVISLNEGEVKFQAFNQNAIHSMDEAKRNSNRYLLVVMFMCAYSAIFTYVNRERTDEFLALKKWE